MAGDEIHDRGFYIDNNPMDDDDPECLHAVVRTVLA
jgi:hypothetical protein